MTTAAKVVPCIGSFSCASLSPALMLQRGLTALLHRRFVSSSGKDREAVVNVDVEKRQIYASNFMNKTGLNPMEVGNSLTAGVLKQTTIIDAGSQPICRDMQATTPTVPRVFDAILSVYTGPYGNSYSCTSTYGWGTTKAVDVARQQAAKLIGAHQKEICPDTALISIMMANNDVEAIRPMEEIGKLCRRNGVLFCTYVDRPKNIRARYTHHRPKVWIGPLISGSSQEPSLRSGTHAHSLAFTLEEPCRIAQEENEYTCTSNPFFPQNSIPSSTLQDSNYIHKPYHNKRPKQFTRTFWTMGGHHNADRKTSKPKTTTEGSRAGIRKANLTEVPNSKVAENTTNNRRNPKWVISYSKITIPQAEKRLGLRLDLCGIPVKRMLEGKHVLLGPDVILKLKRKIYQDLVHYIRAEGYPTEANVDFKEANINDIVAFTIIPVVSQFICETKRKLRLSREKEITSKDSSTSGMEEFVVMDYISYDEMKYVLVAEAKKASLGEARKQCFLSLKDMRDCNGGGTVYGFITMGDSWRMVSFDGEFKLSQKIELLFETMDEEEERWMADYSILVDCLNVALSNGGKDPVAVV